MIHARPHPSLKVLEAASEFLLILEAVGVKSTISISGHYGMPDETLISILPRGANPY